MARKSNIDRISIDLFNLKKLHTRQAKEMLGGIDLSGVDLTKAYAKKLSGMSIKEVLGLK